MASQPRAREATLDRAQAAPEEPLGPEVEDEQEGDEDARVLELERQHQQREGLDQADHEATREGGLKFFVTSRSRVFTFSADRGLHSQFHSLQNGNVRSIVSAAKHTLIAHKLLRFALPLQFQRLPIRRHSHATHSYA